jgi:glycosyltransferase involved in cell wall biosynthesis
MLGEKALADRTRILLLVPRLNAGGAEQVMALVARGLSREKYEVHLGLVTAAAASGGVVPEWVTVHALGAKRARWAGIKLLRLVWRVRPAVILSGAAEISFVALLARKFFPAKTKILVRQNGTVSAALEMGGVPWFTRMLYRWLYPHADKIICQTRAMAEDMVQELGVSAEKVVVLANPVDFEGIRAAMADTMKTGAMKSGATKTGAMGAEATLWSGNGPHLLAVGRLSREKGYDLLIEALATVRVRFPDAELVIAGAGREEAELRRMCARLKLENAVKFAGRVERPYDYFAGATLFVLSSRYEGMPNALIEAAAAGLPLVATPASGGVVDLLSGRPGAWLAKEISAESLAEALIAALGALLPGQRFNYGFFAREAERAAQATASKESASEHFEAGAQFPVILQGE